MLHFSPGLIFSLLLSACTEPLPELGDTVEITTTDGCGNGETTVYNGKVSLINRADSTFQVQTSKGTGWFGQDEFIKIDKGTAETKQWIIDNITGCGGGMS